MYNNLRKRVCFDIRIVFLSGLPEPPVCGALVKSGIPAPVADMSVTAIHHRPDSHCKYDEHPPKTHRQVNYVHWPCRCNK